MKKRILISGGAGFLGSHFCEHLLAQEYAVTAVDNLHSGRRHNLQSFEEHPDFSFLERDICEDVEDLRGQGWFAVLHLASLASPVDYTNYPLETLHVGSTGTENMLKIARDDNARFLLTSTSEVYGDPLVHPQPETYWGNVNPVGLRGVYDEAKRFAEAMAMAYHRYHNVETRIIRIFNTYGARMRLNDGRALPTFMRQALEGKPITVYGDGSQTRSFCYVDDLVEGIYRLLLSDISDPVNIGNPDEITILDFAREITELTGSRSEIVFEPLPDDDPKIRQPDITTAREKLGWQPTVDRVEGLRRTLQYFRERVASRATS